MAHTLENSPEPMEDVPWAANVSTPRARDGSRAQIPLPPQPNSCLLPPEPNALGSHTRASTVDTGYPDQTQCPHSTPGQSQPSCGIHRMSP